ncbi:MAG: phage replisome organizer N-terminal domain-containing protein [Actinomycetota bacterium]
MAWVRLYTDIRSDMKIKRLTYEERWLWIVMLTLAKESPKPGYLLLAEDIPLDIDDLAAESGLDATTIANAIAEKMRPFAMVAEEGAVYRILNWEKRQFTSDNVTERTRKHRRKSERSGDVPGTPQRQRQKQILYSPQFEAFWKVYPRKIEKLKAFKCWETRLKEGHDPKDLINAAINYARAMKGKDPEFIKYPPTFLGPSKPFEDYLNYRPPHRECINAAMHVRGRSPKNLMRCGCEECTAELERRKEETA